MQQVVTKNDEASSKGQISATMESQVIRQKDGSLRYEEHGNKR